MAITISNSPDSDAASAAPVSDTRQSLIDATVELLMRDGWAALRMRDLAKAVGIRASSIYHHFKTKNDLGLALVHHLHQEVQTHTQMMTDSGNTLRQRLDGLVNMIDGPDCGESCPLYNLQAEFAVLPEEMQQAVHDLVEDMLAGLTRWIDEAKTAGEIRSDCDQRRQAAILLAVCEHGSQLQRVLNDVHTSDLVAEWYLGLTSDHTQSRE